MRSLGNFRAIFAGIASFAMIAAISLALAYQWRLAEVEQRSETLFAELNRNFLKLERSLGYSGLVHNLKNYVLRPGQDEYLELARSDFIEVNRSLDALEETALELRLDIDFGPLRETVAAVLSD